MQPLTPKRLAAVCGLLAAILFLSILISLKLGAVPISMVDLAANLGRILIGQADHLPSEQSLIVRELRLPRILLGVLVGAALSVAGTGFQALLRNPLADPYVLGVSSGAAVGAIISLVVAPSAGVAMPIAAFAGALGTIAAVYFLGRRSGQLDSQTLLLAGIISASFLSAVIMFLMTTLSGGEYRGIAFWLMGDLTSTRTPVGIGWLFAALAIGIGAIYTTAADLNLLLTGEQEAMHLGVEVHRVKVVVYVAASLLTGLAVSVSGAIGYVGLIVPHVMRLLFGSDHRLLIPTSALGGAIVIVIADTLARTLWAPTELPVGAMTAIAGAPMFIYLLRRRLG
jgi:iron complex transport system permease protein